MGILTTVIAVPGTYVKNKYKEDPRITKSRTWSESCDNWIVEIILSNIITAPFPHGKLVTYKYIADVNAGVESSLFVSNYGIECLLNVQHVTDTNSKNTYYVNLTNVKYGLHNGFVKHYESLSVMESIPDVANAILNPFLVVYDENGHVRR